MNLKGGKLRTLARRCAGEFVRAPTLRGSWSVGCPWGCICDAERATNAFLACSGHGLHTELHFLSTLLDNMVFDHDGGKRGRTARGITFGTVWAQFLGGNYVKNTRA